MRILLISFLLFYCGFVSSQNVLLSGKIYDKKSKYPISGAVIFINGKQEVYSDSDGIYSVKCNPGDTLTIFDLMYEHPEWIVQEGFTKKDFYLKEKVFIIDDGSYSNTFFKHHWLKIYPVYSFKNKEFGAGITYRFALHRLYKESDGLSDFAEFATDHLLNCASFNLNLVKPDWNKDAFFYPQLTYARSLYFLNIRYLRDILPSGSIGYYWKVNDNLNFKQGNIAVSTDIRLWRKYLFGRTSIELSVGYTWFFKDTHNDFFAVKASIKLR